MSTNCSEVVLSLVSESGCYWNQKIMDKDMYDNTYDLITAYEHHLESIGTVTILVNEEGNTQLRLKKTGEPAMVTIIEEDIL